MFQVQVLVMSNSQLHGYL